MKILNEMPYIKTGEGNNLFDLEIENFDNAEDILDYLEDIFSGKKEKDKYGNIIQIKNPEQKKKVINDIKNNKIFYNLIINKFSDREMRLIKMLLDY